MCAARRSPLHFCKSASTKCIFERSKCVVIRWRESCTVRRVRKNLGFQLSLFSAKSLWMIRYADLKQVSNFSTAYVTVFRSLFSSRELTPSTLSAVYKVVGQPERSLSTAPVAPLWNISTNSLHSFSQYSVLRTLQHSSECFVLSG
jgi:hypothetical protein